MQSVATFLFLAWLSQSYSAFAMALGLESTSHVLPDLYEASIAELQHGLEKGSFTSVDLVKVHDYPCTRFLCIPNLLCPRQAYFARILEVNHQGASLHAVIETNPSALKQAVALDLERKERGKRSLLHGIPILVKDNIATLHEEGMVR